jgi:hypothetical protein
MFVVSPAIQAYILWCRFTHSYPLMLREDVELEKLSLRLRGECEMDLSHNVMDQVMIKGEFNIDEPCR